MWHTEPSPSEPPRPTESTDTDMDAIRGVPLGVIGFLLLVAVALACAFYIAAQVVQTP